jgi:propionate CoA-transferase
MVVLLPSPVHYRAFAPIWQALYWTVLRKPVLSAAEAVQFIRDGQTVAIGGSGAGHAIPDILLRALGGRFRASGHPRDLTLLHAFGVGNQRDRGLQHMAFPEMYRRVVGGHWSMAPAMAQLAAEDAFEAYCLPAGVMVQLFHAAAAGSPGWLTRAGLHTFIDPRLEGGKLNAKAREDLVELVERDGREYLFYRAIPIDVALLHASEADPEGNLGMNREAGFWHNCALAQAAKASGGITIAAVQRLAGPREIHPRDVRVPGCFVDYLVLDPEQGQTFQTAFEPAWTGDALKAEDEFGDYPLSVRKVIARRAALELAPGAVLNVGFGIPDGVVKVAREQGLAATIVPTIEHGQFGGIPAEGLDFGSMYNPAAIVETGHMFNFYHGRGVDQCYLGFLEIDREGNVNVSKLGSAVIGTGGFIDISQGARKCVFCGTLAVRSRAELAGGTLRYLELGRPKIVERVLQVTFSGKYARRLGQAVLYVTESAVFRLTAEGIRLEELAPGIDLERDIRPQLGFQPLLADPLKTMPPELFRDRPLPRSLFTYYK